MEGAEYSSGFTKVRQFIAARKAAARGAATLVPPYTKNEPPTLNTTPVLGSATPAISGIQRKLPARAF